jgi:hypothetical protein
MNAIDLDIKGHQYLQSLGLAERNRRGATYTPAWLVEAMMLWAKGRIQPIRIVDPGAGSGRFSISAALHWPNAKVVAFDTDTAALSILKSSAQQVGVVGRIEIRNEDYIQARLESAAGPTLFIGNPPYVRHHHLPQETKAWWRAACQRFGEHASKLAGLHNMFFVRTLELVTEGDIGCFVVGAEWLDTNYGSTLRRLCAGPLGLEELFVADPDVQIFPEVMTRVGIFGFRPFAKRAAVKYARIRTSGSGVLPTRFQRIAMEKLAAGSPWSNSLQDEPKKFYGGTNGDSLPLGDLFRVSRGQVTGKNEVWVYQNECPPLPEKFLVRAITNAHEIINAPDYRISSPLALRCVVDLPANLSEVSSCERALIDRFLSWARTKGADSGYVVEHRKPWWKVRMPPPPAAFVTYMARRAPVFALNDADVSMLNICHGLFPKVPIPRNILSRIVLWLNANVSVLEGRTYAGGMVKFEPREVERIQIPLSEVT